LTLNDGFRSEAYKVSRIVQGYLCSDAMRTVRIRIKGDEGFITVKSAPNKRGWSRYEFEQSIPLAEAETMLKLCLPGVIDKERHYVRVAEHIWEVDVFHGANEGLIVAEIELLSENDAFVLPAWIGEEVSGDARYYNSALAMRPYSQWG